MNVGLRPATRFWLWGYPRGSLAYDLMWVLILLFLLLVPAAWLGDPMVRP